MKHCQLGELCLQEINSKCWENCAHKIRQKTVNFTPEESTLSDAQLCWESLSSKLRFVMFWNKIIKLKSVRCLRVNKTSCYTRWQTPLVTLGTWNPTVGQTVFCVCLAFKGKNFQRVLHLLASNVCAGRTENKHFAQIFFLSHLNNDFAMHVIFFLFSGQRECLRDRQRNCFRLKENVHKNDPEANHEPSYRRAQQKCRKQGLQVSFTAWGVKPKVGTKNCQFHSQFFSWHTRRRSIQLSRCQCCVRCRQTSFRARCLQCRNISCKTIDNTSQWENFFLGSKNKVQKLHLLNFF